MNVDDLVAREEIRDLVARYAVAVDSRDLDALVALFVTDVQVGRDRVGHDALRAYFDDVLRTVGVTILQVGTHAIDLEDADHARGVVYCAGEVERDDRWFRQAILYRDAYRRESGLWRFVRRVEEHWYEVELPGVPPGSGAVPASWPTWSAFWEGR